MKILGTDIFTVRGDTISITITCKNKNGTTKILVPGEDKLFFTVKKNVNDKTDTIFKDENDIPIIDGKGRLTINNADTASLQFGVYYYDIQLIDKENRITTIVPKSKFVIEEEITSATP